MAKILVAFGTRPEAIKMAPVIQELKKHPDLQPIVCITAQHREMLDQTLELFGITPDEDLDLMTPGQDLSSLSARILTGMAPIFETHKPDAVLVQGDTTTTFCAALSAFYHRIPVGHIEAGLRTGDLTAPFPEEGNRVLTTRLASWHFTPTDSNRDALLKEGVNSNAVYVTGNTVIDALLWETNRINSGEYDTDTTILLNRFERPFILVTGHRRESFGQGFNDICHAIKQIAGKHPDIDIVYPVHLNPNVQEPVNRILKQAENIHLIQPLGYESFVAMMNKSLFVLTDSGGVQEEAPSLGKPVLVMRDKTERNEALTGGVRLVGTDPQKIVEEAEKLLTDSDHYEKMSTALNPYGDGNAAKRIATILAEHFQHKQ
ncbi:MAG: UDP-N-acetylglucosamine 2-epimerase (non-hydrolyzing) [Candidatus Sedimenticola sp. 20ELBAFRAG]